MSLDEFYNNLDILPVEQVDFRKRKFAHRRINLLLDLGIHPANIRGKNLLIFGPGSGQNETVLFKFKPKSMTLVDNSQIALRKNQDFYKSKKVKIIKNKIELFKSTQQFDLVWVEGVLSHNQKPHDLFKSVISNLNQACIGVVTTVDSISWFSDIMRKIIFLIEFKSGYPKNKDKVLNFYSKQLKYLPNRTRSTLDYFNDNIFQSFENSDLFTFIDLLSYKKDIILYKSTPNFNLDFEWYKNKVINYPSNQSRLNMYYRTNINLISSKIELKITSVNFGVELENCCNEIWLLHKRLNRDVSVLEKVIDQLTILQKLLKKEIFVSEAISEIKGYFMGKIYLNELKLFNSFWGRGQQYHSFIKGKYKNLVNIF